MKPTTSGGGYHPLTPDSEGSVRDAKGASVRDVGERVVFHQSAILSDRKVAPASNVAPSKLQTEWAKAPTQVSLVQGMQLAAEIDRVTGAFSVFVQAACPSLSGAKFAKAVKNIALLAPTHSLDTDEQAVAYMTNFLPPPRSVEERWPYAQSASRPPDGGVDTLPAQFGHEGSQGIWRRWSTRRATQVHGT